MHTRTCGKQIIPHQEPNSNEHSTNEGDFPWNAAIYHVSNDTLAFMCVGSLVQSNIVLTAARCVFEKNRQVLAQVQVRLGKYNLNDLECNIQTFWVSFAYQKKKT